MSKLTVRVGIKVERWHDSCSFKMFHCRQRYRGDAHYVPTAMWMESVVDDMPYSFSFDEIEKIPVGGSRRYWVHMTVSGWIDYWGEYEQEVDIHKIRPCGKISK